MAFAFDTIDWCSLTDAYGPATEVPVWLRQLASRDPDESDEAIDALFGIIWHQGSIYSSSIAALPVLAEYLTDEQHWHRDAVAALIASIVTGSCFYHGSAMWPELIRDFEENNLKQIGSSISEQVAAERPVIEAARAFGCAILPALLPYLESQDPEVRQMIAGAAANFPEQAKAHKEAIETAVKRETEDWVREALAAAQRAISEGG